MPPSYEMEALKAQAVCARTYAYRQIQGNAYSQYGAHVEDILYFLILMFLHQIKIRWLNLRSNIKKVA